MGSEAAPYRRWRLPPELEAGAAQLPEDFWQGGWAENVEVETVPWGNGLFLERDGDRARIGFQRPIHFFRALGHLRQPGRREALREEAVIPHAGVMVDASRNSVPRPETLRRILDAMAPMGLDRLILYMEDTFPLEGEPYFGYLRGGYTREELQALDAYAARYGIALVPSIQVLGHLEKVLRHPAYAALKDSDSCLLVGDPAVEALLRKMFRSLAACFSARWVLVGMDETRGLGLGRARALNQSPMALFTRHLQTVERLAAEEGFTVALYSDMLFSYSSARGAYLDPDVTFAPEVKAALPPSVQPVYWDYYSADPALLDRMMERHRELGVFAYAGPLLSVSSFCVQYPATFRVAQPALAAAKRHGAELVYGCLWHDDGAECSDLLGLYGMQLYAEHAYSREGTIPPERVDARFRACTGLEARWFRDAARLDAVPWVNRENRWPPNLCKYALWQDPLLGLFDEDMKQYDLAGHYTAVAMRLKADLAAAGDRGGFLRVPLALAEVLTVKCHLGARLRAHYTAEDREALGEDAALIRETARRVETLRRLHRAAWMEENAPLGWERLDLRYGGLLARLDTADARVRDWLDGKCARLEELETPRYPLDSSEKGLGQGIWKVYRDIATLSDG